MNKMIMVVEDDLDLRECLAEAIRGKGYAVCTAVSATEAIGHLRRGERVDLIISDFVMRDGDGIDLLRYIRSLDLRIPFFFISGQSRMSTEEIFKVGAQEFIPKPFSLSELLETIEHHLSRGKEVDLQ